ncbi:Cob(I)alamin adenosyltransferase [Emiliania huxleyi CCMP1516]|uniref:Cobalamin adenosyltransferase-like domain-containing protein n=2 Tax=Emiliania huxleyi TaxID=2903 RepID=A0A0D3JT17_EMIH1|nr:Cob(I)alamin adenosyltransferase [Emiliania huxleyi CCMP1516]EOD26652.1 Cob(I)alamin adenosyltransferase [Emiliania huxleyi CCMP1516]|eukprot:XP_005779081.1 Cob(I)alamin adenosyltransferase [Emiliania huxleyi CCMP1516]
MRPALSSLARSGQRLSAAAPALRGFTRTGFTVYTRTGDKGKSSLFNGERRRKDDVVFDALGAVDELSAAIGLARAHCEEGAAGCTKEEAVEASVAPAPGPAGLRWLLPQLEGAQRLLLDVGSAIATPQTSSSEKHLQRVGIDGAAEASVLEARIDTMDAQLPPLTVFILPGGGAPAAALHMSRAVCRRSERCVVPLVEAGDCPAEVGVYLNRLSDYFFVAARYAAASAGHAEERRGDDKAGPATGRV